MFEHQSENINVIHCHNHEEVMGYVGNAAAGGALTTTAGTLYRQGGRLCFQTALSLQAIVGMTSVTSPKDGSVDEVLKNINRPLDKAHAKAIGDYISESVKAEKPYILPSVTLNCDQPVDVVTYGSSPSRAGMMLLPLGVKMEVTDGQHRIEGIRRAMAQNPACGTDSIGAMITFTGTKNGPAQVHQDFADCAKVKPIAQSMLAVFDRRNPANGIVLDLVDSCPLFKHTVDASKKTVSSRTTAVWTTNQIRVMLKWALIGFQCGDNVFSSNAVSTLGSRDSEAYKNFLDSLVDYIGLLTQHNPTLNKLANLSQERKGEIPDIRESSGSLLLSGSGLAVLGYLWFRLRQLQGENPAVDTDLIIRRIASVNWSGGSKGNPNPIFSGNLKINPERTQSGAKYVKLAGETIWNRATLEIDIAA